MGVLDKLLFWRRKTTETKLDVEGCFTLPGAEIGVDLAGAPPEVATVPLPEAVQEDRPEDVAGQFDQPADQATAE